MITFADRILKFYKSLKIENKLPKGVGVLNPYHQEVAFELCSQFYKKYYNDNNTRTAILGINPGRLGGGVTGVPFTDPVKLEVICGIKNELPKKPELSADFIYQMIGALGGPEAFYQHFFFSSVSPLGFIQEGKNLNYYDTPALQKSLDKFIQSSLQQITQLGVRRDKAYCLGEGQNFKYLTALNKTEKLFDELIPLAHPRFVMQYKRRYVNDYIEDYRRKLMGK